ncbi:cytochrome P450 [Hymenobacter tibetensis]|uniref:Cytochrome P450 n=1 Tax=Hymenobacter tibetensis TaxID=497967 RepID=A0ABY4D1D1_9BACT|nr:cytochrome P450 [Hymenobacter tibetensis]UOG76341.1 cytochrome P450 [Hymenobacter tibetensis]
MPASLPEFAAKPIVAPVPWVPRWRTLLGSVAFTRDPIGRLNNILTEYGDTVGVHLGGIRPGMVTRDPALVQHILQKNHRRYLKSDLTHGLIRYLGRGLLTNEGADWLRQRRLIQPGFHRQRLAGLTRLMQTAAAEWTTELTARTTDGAAIVDTHEAMTRVAFRIVARATFSASLSEAEGERLAAILTEIQAFYVRTIRQPYLRPWFRARGTYRRNDLLSQELRELVRGYIRQRRQHPPATPAEAPDDLLQMLLDTRYEDTGEPMQEEQLLDEVNILLVAGHETSANALSWLFYLLAQNPAVADKVRAEMEAVLAGRTPEFNDLPQLPYSLQVVQEALRLYPPAWILDRVALEDDEFQGQRIPKGTLFSLYLYGVHHHPALWPDAEVFRPERFAPGAVPAPPPYGYLPFGGGPRLCVGSHFALTEIQLVLLETLRYFSVEPAQESPPVLMPLVTLRPQGELLLRFRRL